MKRIFVVIAILLNICSVAFASSNITINSVEKKEVMNYILSTVASQYNNVIIENANDYGVTFLMTNTGTMGLFGQYTYTQENRIGFTLVEQGDNTLLSVSETCTLTYPNGQRETRPVGTAVTETPILQRIKGYFSGTYLYGYNTENKTKDGGFVIRTIEPNGAFNEAGIKVGDIIISVNGERVKKQKEKFLYGGFNDFSRQTTLEFLIKRGKIEKVYKLTSKFYPPTYVRPVSKQNEIKTQSSKEQASNA